MRRILFISCVCILVLLAFSLYAEETGSEKKKITTIDDLPRYTYDVQTTLTELITSKELFTSFAAEVRTDIESVLGTYEIEDKTTLKNYHGILGSLDMLYGNYDEVLFGIEKVRELEEKPARKLMMGLINNAIIQAQREVGYDDETAYKQAFSRYLSESIDELPWEIIQERVEEIKGRMELFSENVMLGLIESQFEAAVLKTHQISSDVAAQVIGIRYAIEIQLPLKNEIVAVYDKYIKENRVVKADIWKERSVDLSETDNLQPIVVAIWDTGVDIEVYPDQIFVNTNEKLNGEDDDSNGFIDDIYGVAYTLEEEKTTELLYPIENAEERLPGMKEMMKGLLDVQASIDSPEATTLKQKIASMHPVEVKTFLEDLMQFILYFHGTHVAGVAVEGNPFARILIARLTADYRTIPLPPTVERAHKSAKMYREVVEYFKTNNVRVVNMSWGGTLRGTESDLEANGIGKDAEERAKLAREIFDIGGKALYDAIQRAPEILFITAAGNENDDVSFEDYYPSAFGLPNILVVGAVDQAGDETSFTSFGERVDVYANGFEVESYLPGGEKLSASGTSASSPNAANLASKLIVLKPSLSPVEVIDLIKKGADRSEDERLLLINPKHSFELLASRKSIDNQLLEIEDRESRTEEWREEIEY